MFILICSEVIDMIHRHNIISCVPTDKCTGDRNVGIDKLTDRQALINRYSYSEGASFRCLNAPRPLPCTDVDVLLRGSTTVGYNEIKEAEKRV